MTEKPFSRGERMTPKKLDRNKCDADALFWTLVPWITERVGGYEENMKKLTTKTTFSWKKLRKINKKMKNR